MEQSDSNIAYEAWNLVFDGTNYVDIGVCLYSAENISRDFEIIVNLSARDNFGNSTILNCMKEKSPYPGFVLRNRNNSPQIECMARGTYLFREIPSSIYMNADIHIKRTKGSITAWIDGEEASQFFTETVSHDVPVTIGASLNGSLQPWRYWRGTINHIKIEWLS